MVGIEFWYLLVGNWLTRTQFALNLNTNPYKSPTKYESSVEPLGEVANRSVSLTVVIGNLAAGFTFGLIWYPATSLAIKYWLIPEAGPDIFAYIQEAVQLSWPTSILMGVLVGCCGVPFWCGCHKIAATSLSILAFMSTIWITYIWRQDDVFGNSSSKYVLFFPLYAFSFLIFATAIVSLCKTPKKGSE